MLYEYADSYFPGIEWTVDIEKDEDFLYFLHQIVYGSRDSVKPDSEEIRSGIIIILSIACILIIIVPIIQDNLTFIFWSMLLGIGSLYLGINNVIMRRMYIGYKNYAKEKQSLFQEISMIEKSISSDIIDPKIQPGELEKIKESLRRIQELPIKIEKNIKQIGEYSKGSSYKNVTQILHKKLELERIGMVKLFHYSNAIIKRWLEWHHTELKDESMRLNKQIAELLEKGTIYEGNLELIQKGLESHIESSGVRIKAL